MFVDRTTTISIQNDLPYDLKYVSCKGAFYEGFTPPGGIRAGNIGTCGVGNPPFIMEGPEGNLIYEAIEGEVSKFRVGFYWSHPFKKQTSTYRCWSEPGGHIKAILYPGITTELHDGIPKAPGIPYGHNTQIAWRILPMK